MLCVRSHSFHSPHDLHHQILSCKTRPSSNHPPSHSHCPGPAPATPRLLLCSPGSTLVPRVHSPWTPQGDSFKISVRSRHSQRNPKSLPGLLPGPCVICLWPHCPPPPLPLATSPATSGFQLLLGHSKLTPVPEPPCWLFPLGMLCPDTHVWVFNQMSPHQSGLPCWFCGHPRHFLSLQLPSLHHTIYYHLRRICFSMVFSVFTLGT